MEYSDIHAHCGRKMKQHSNLKGSPHYKEHQMVSQLIENHVFERVAIGRPISSEYIPVEAHLYGLYCGRCDRQLATSDMDAFDLGLLPNFCPNCGQPTNRSYFTWEEDDEPIKYL